MYSVYKIGEKIYKLPYLWSDYLKLYYPSFKYYDRIKASKNMAKNIVKQVNKDTKKYLPVNKPEYVVSTYDDIVLANYVADYLNIEVVTLFESSDINKLCFIILNADTEEKSYSIEDIDLSRLSKRSYIGVSSINFTDHFKKALEKIDGRVNSNLFNIYPYFSSYQMDKPVKTIDLVLKENYLYD